MLAGDVTSRVVISGLNLSCEFLFVCLDSRSDFMRFLNRARRVPNISEQAARISSLPAVFFGMVSTLTSSNVIQYDVKMVQLPFS